MRDPWKDARVVVVGAARSGVAAACLLLDVGARVKVTDLRPADELEGVEELAARGAVLACGGHPDDLWTDADAAVVSPGIDPAAAPLRAARLAGVPRIPEVELAARFTDVPIVAITGSNGKSTVTSMVGAILDRAGLQAPVCGNIGTPLSAAVRGELDGAPRDRYVVEMSSFQCEAIQSFRPRWSAVLNLSPDHLDRHPDFDAYARAKLRLVVNCTGEDWLVYGADDPELVDRLPDGPVRRLPFSGASAASGATPAAWIEDGRIRFRGGDGATVDVLGVDDLRVLGEHNRLNASAAAALGILAGADPDEAAGALRSFPGLEHRMEPVGALEDADGIRWINDSKATNVDAALAALDGLEAPVWLILGGRDKGADFRRLRPALERVRRVLLIGEAAERIADALDGAAPLERCGTLERAVRRCRADAAPGDVVLLAPACTSWDQYSDFEDRGRHFKELAGC